MDWWQTSALQRSHSHKNTTSSLSYHWLWNVQLGNPLPPVFLCKHLKSRTVNRSGPSEDSHDKGTIKRRFRRSLYLFGVDCCVYLVGQWRRCPVLILGKIRPSATSVVVSLYKVTNGGHKCKYGCVGQLLEATIRRLWLYWTAAKVGVNVLHECVCIQAKSSK